MADIAKQAELGKSTLYNYFKSKEEILLAIHERAHDLLASHFEQVVKEHELGSDQVRAIGRAYFAFARQYPNYFKMVSRFEFNESELPPQDVMSNVKRVDQILVQSIRRGIEDGSLRTDLRPENISKTLWAMATGVSQMLDLKGEMFLKRLEIQPEDIAETFFAIIQSGLKVSS